MLPAEARETGDDAPAALTEVTSSEDLEQSAPQMWWGHRAALCIAGCTQGQLVQSAGKAKCTQLRSGSNNARTAAHR